MLLRFVTIAASLTLVLGGCSEPEISYSDQFTNLDPAWVVTADEAYEWASVKNDNLPTLTGSPEWLNYMAFLEEKLLEYGAVDTFRNSWSFNRWDTSDDSSDWALVSDGAAVRVANYGAYSGSTGPEGITAEMIYYDHENPPASIEGKIVVIPTRPHPQEPFPEDYLINYTFNDYEFATDAETLPPPFRFVDPAESFTFDIWWQLAQGLDRIAKEGRAAGAVIVYDMAFDRTEGLYTFPVPTLYDSPTLILSREDGKKVIEDAKAGRSATLTLEASLETADAYQLIAYLPGKNYGTPDDEQIVLVNHTDGPSITQDNGALGLLAIVKYFSNIPREQRPRTLTIYFDCRHYMPGMEKEYISESWLNRYPEAQEKIVAVVQAEHLGEMDYREVGGKVEATGQAEQSYLWTRNNPLLIDAAISAVQKHGWSRAQVSVPERPGINGGLQQVWWGVGVIALPDTGYYNCDVWHCLDHPGFGLGGFLGPYWSSASTIERWNRDLFLSQAATMTELTGVLLTADLQAIKPLRTTDSFLDNTNRDEQFGTVDQDEVGVGDGYRATPTGTYVFHCDNEQSYTVQTTVSSAWIFGPAETTQLFHSGPAAGGRFSDGSFEVNIEGQNARIGASAGKLANCVNDARQAVWEAAKLGGADFRAVGNEPGWHLEIREQRRIVLVSNYGESSIEVPLPEPHTDQELRKTTWDAGQLKLEITGQSCQDTMADESYESTVTVYWNNQILRGCGKALH